MTTHYLVSCNLPPIPHYSIEYEDEKEDLIFYLKVLGESGFAKRNDEFHDGIDVILACIDLWKSHVPWERIQAKKTRKLGCGLYIANNLTLQLRLPKSILSGRIDFGISIFSHPLSPGWGFSNGEYRYLYHSVKPRLEYALPAIGEIVKFHIKMWMFLNDERESSLVYRSFEF